MSVATLPMPMSSPASAVSSSKSTDATSALKPNPHPYAIKTTSTAILARSTSSGHAVAARHHYIPTTTQSTTKPPSSPTKSKSEYRGHRYSTSLSSDRPPAFPAGPGPPSPSRSARSLSEDSAPPSPSPSPLPLDPFFERRSHSRTRTRAGTLPPSHFSNGVNDDDDGDNPFATSVPAPALGTDDLPSNPKLWTPSQLSSYLITALRVRSSSPSSSAPVAAPVARDIAAWVRAHGIAGRTFFRWADDDLHALGINTLWRAALLDAARALRQNVLRGRIWGNGAAGDEDGEEEDDESAAAPFASALYLSASSSSSIDLSEPSASTSPSSTGARLRRRNAGRVRGLVTRWERSAAESASESERESPVRSPSKKLPDLPLFPDEYAAQETKKLDGEEEPTVEELLARGGEDGDAPRTGSWGARAWEAFDTGSTVKRADERVDDENTTFRFTDGSGTFRPANGSGSAPGSAKRIKGGSSKRTNGDASRRVVTALFIREPEHEAEADVEPMSSPEPTSPTKLEIVTQDALDADADARLRAVEAALEAEIASTRAQLAAFRARLEHVESRVSTMESEAEETRLHEIDAAVAHARCEWEAQAARAAEEERVHVRVESPTREAGVQVEARSSSNQGQGPSPAAREDTAGNNSKTGTATVVPRAAFVKALLDPHSIRDLPGYIALVGFGVCAVVLKVVLRRIAASRRT